MRKRLDIQEAISRVQKLKKTLRVFISNTAADQPWQQQDVMQQDSVPQAPNWTLRIEGRVLDVCLCCRFVLSK